MAKHRGFRHIRWEDGLTEAFITSKGLMSTPPNRRASQCRLSTTIAFEHRWPGVPERERWSE